MDINNYVFKGKTELKSLISLNSVSPFDIFEILCLAKNLKTLSKYGELPKEYRNNFSVLITSDKLSKTRIAFEIASRSLNISPIPLTLREKSISDYIDNRDVLKVYERFPISSIIIDTELYGDAEKIANQVNIPTVFASELTGPCQVLALLLTIWEEKSRLSNLKAVVLTDNPLLNESLYYGLAKCEIDISVVTKNKSEKAQKMFDELKQYSNIDFCDNLTSAVKSCDVIYCDNHELGSDYIITQDHLTLTNNALFLQNIPFDRNKQAKEGVYNSNNSKIYELGENFLHVLRAVLNIFSK